MIATTIDEVLEHLDHIITRSKQDENPLGYFAALYRKVTFAVKTKLGTKYFDDDKRMEELDVVFANRYLQAYNDYTENRSITKSWDVAFKTAKDEKYMVLQHLFFGMNAHINLDLGIAAAQITTPATISDLHADFNRINYLLGSLTNDVQEDFGKIWPKLLWMLKFFGRTDDYLISFGMNIARDGAWKFANELVGKKGSELANLISERDVKVAGNRKVIAGKGWIERRVYARIRRGEVGTVAQKIQALQD